MAPDCSVITGLPGAEAIIKWKLDVAVLQDSTLYYGRGRFAAAAVPEEGCGTFLKGTCPGGAQGGGGKGSLVCLHTCIRMYINSLGAQTSQSEAILHTPRLVATSQRRENRYNRI